MRIKVMGIGGIGCCLLPPLVRFVNFSSEGETEIVLVDGDRFEEKNRERQVFSRLGNKADVTVARFGEEFPGLHLRSVSEYVTEGNVVSLIREGDVVFLCVDNHATRKLVSDRCEELSDAVLISGGNEFTDGNVQIFISSAHPQAA